MPVHVSARMPASTPARMHVATPAPMPAPMPVHMPVEVSVHDLYASTRRYGMVLDVYRDPESDGDGPMLGSPHHLY